jgi:hypothetical protein
MGFILTRPNPADVTEKQSHLLPLKNKGYRRKHNNLIFDLWTLLSQFELETNLLNPLLKELDMIYELDDEPTGEVKP